MPELPEVETMRRGVLPVVSARITGICRLTGRLRPITVSPGMPTFQRRVVGTRIQHVDRLGKRLLMWLDTDQAMVFEPRMTGLVLLADPPSHEHLRFRVDLRGTQVPHLWYWDRRGLGSVRLLNRRQVEQQLGPPRLGPDALGMDAEQLRSTAGTASRAGQGGAAGPVRLGWRRQFVCVGDSPCRTHPSAGALRSTHARTMAAVGRQHVCRSGRGDSLRRFDLGGRHVSHRIEQSGRLPEPPSCLRSGGRDVPELRTNGHPAHRAGAAFHVLLPGVPDSPVTMNATRYFWADPQHLLAVLSSRTLRTNAAHAPSKTSVSRQPPKAGSAAMVRSMLETDARKRSSRCDVLSPGLGPDALGFTETLSLDLPNHGLIQANQDGSHQRLAHAHVAQIDRFTGTTGRHSVRTERRETR